MVLIQKVDLLPSQATMEKNTIYFALWLTIGTLMGCNLAHNGGNKLQKHKSNTKGQRIMIL